MGDSSAAVAPLFLLYQRGATEAVFRDDIDNIDDIFTRISHAACAALPAYGSFGPK